MIGIDDYILTDNFVLQLKNFLRSRNYLQSVPTREHLFDDSVRQTLAEFQAHKRLRITDGSLNLETLRAIGKEMKPMPLKRLTTELKWSAMFNLELKQFFTLGGIWLTGTPAIQKQSLERFKKMMGSQRMAFVKIGTACTIWGDFTHLTASNSGGLIMSGIGDTENNRIFGQVMGNILSSKETVEYTLALSAETSDGRVKTTEEFGGAMTFSKTESQTGNVQIFVHQESRKFAMKFFRTPLAKGMWSGGGEFLEFDEDMVDAHEYGHAYIGINGGDPDDELGKRMSLIMENAVRERYSSPQRRTKHI